MLGSGRRISLYAPELFWHGDPFCQTICSCSNLKKIKVRWIGNRNCCLFQSFRRWNEMKDKCNDTGINLVNEKTQCHKTTFRLLWNLEKRCKPACESTAVECTYASAEREALQQSLWYVNDIWIIGITLRPSAEHVCGSRISRMAKLNQWLAVGSGNHFLQGEEEENSPCMQEETLEVC